MNKLEVFFDYACPFCLQGHEYLRDLAPGFPQIQIVWCPCEAHPRPETKPHSDLCLQGMYFVLEQGTDIWAYHNTMYHAVIKEKINFEDIDTLANAVSAVVDSNKFKAALTSGQYADIQQKGNAYAFEQSGVWAVPSYRMNGQKLDSIEGVGVTKQQLKAFMEL